MLDIFAQYATNEIAENEGTWVEHGDAKFLVARAGNRQYVKMLSNLVDKNQKLLDKKDEAADNLSDKIMVDVLASTILMGWENVGFKGEQLEYSAENARKLLSIKDFRQEVLKWANDINNFKAQEEAEAVKN